MIVTTLPASSNVFLKQFLYTYKRLARRSCYCCCWLSAQQSFLQEEYLSLEKTRARFSDVLKRHSELSERLSRDSDKTVFERLQKEFDAAHASQTQEILLDGEQWNDGLLATIRERVHMEVDRKAMPIDAKLASVDDFQEKITYKVGNKVVCCLEGARIGIQYETFFAAAGEPCEIYHIVLESKSFLEKMTVIEHSIPFFLPIREAENDLLYSNSVKFIDYVGDLMQAYVDRREQVQLIKELYGNQIGELYHSLPYNMVEFVLDDLDCKITVTLRYADLICILPTRVRVMAWPIHKTSTATMDKNYLVPGSGGRKGNGIFLGHPNPVRLSYAEEALQSMSFSEEIVLNLPQALNQISQQRSGPS